MFVLPGNSGQKGNFPPGMLVATTGCMFHVVVSPGRPLDEASEGFRPSLAGHVHVWLLCVHGGQGLPLCIWAVASCWTSGRVSVKAFEEASLCRSRELGAGAHVVSVGKTCRRDKYLLWTWPGGGAHISKSCPFNKTYCAPAMCLECSKEEICYVTILQMG